MATSLRTALLNKETISVEVAAPSSIRPRAGSMIEEIRQRGRSIDLVWDDGVVLHTALWPLGRWRILHKADRWQLQEVNAVVDIGDVLAVCRGAATVEMHRDYDPRRHPRSGPSGPDISVPGADIAESIWWVANLPPHLNVNRLELMPVSQSFAGFQIHRDRT